MFRKCTFRRPQLQPPATALFLATQSKLFARYFVAKARVVYVHPCVYTSYTFVKSAKVTRTIIAELFLLFFG